MSERQAPGVSIVDKQGHQWDVIVYCIYGGEYNTYSYIFRIIIYRIV